MAAVASAQLRKAMQKLATIVVLLAAGFSKAASLSGFTGGAGDGYAYAKALLPTQPALTHLYEGGAGDGYAHAEVLSPRQSSLTYLYQGGTADGYDSSTLMRPIPPVRLTRFLGGGYDGYDRNAVLGLPNWSIGDTDANGLPDWWELKYFSVLTGTNPNADPDHDGASNLAEYLAGTDPTDATSCFRITKLTVTVPRKVLVWCPSNMFYTLQRSTNLMSGWVDVPTQVRLSPTTNGIMEMDDPYGGSNGYYRVLLEH